MPADSKLLTDAQALKRCALFSDLDDDDRRLLAQRSHRRQFRAGDYVCSFGDPGQSMMAIITGTIRISRPTSKGKVVILADLPAGEFIGDMAVLDGRERSADCVALTNVELLVLDRRELLPFLEEHPRLCLALLKILCARLRLADERMADIGFVDLPARLAKTLLRQGTSRADHSRPFKLSISQTVLAEMTGATRESVNRQLREWQRRGVVDLKGGWRRARTPRSRETFALARTRHS